MSEQGKSSEQRKYIVSIEQAKGLTIGDNARVTNNIFYVNEPSTSDPSAGPQISLPFSREELLRSAHAASNELRDYPDQIAGEHLMRPEVAEILEWVVESGPTEKLGMILDQPGGGKTVVMHDVLEGLEAAGIPVLAIKADVLSGVDGTGSLGRRLGLPMSVEDCARYLADEGLFVVVLDQIDALSMVLSRDQATLDAVLSSVSRLREIPNVRLVASCRTFDLRHDPRLSAVKVDREFELRPLTEEQVNDVLLRIDVNPARLLPEHKTLLTVPLHLHLYAQVMTGADTGRARERFRTLQELYDALWQRRIEAVPPESPRPEERIEAIYKLVDAMRERSQLTAPVAVLDRHASAARYLEQTAFIRRERGNYLFAHQTLFDYCYARRFVASGKSIGGEILKGEQGLFERSQMVHVLAYLRGADEHNYRRELAALLFADNLRVHLRLLLTDWFGSLTRPTENELRIAQRLMGSPDGCAQFLSSATGNEEWFDALDAGTLERLFRHEDQRVANAFYWFLGSVIEKGTREVVALLRPYLGRSEQWNSHIAFVLDRLTSWESEEALTLLCDLLRQGGSNMGQEYLLSLHHLASSNPAGGCRALRALLDRRVEEMLREEDGDEAKSGEADTEEIEFRRSLRRGRFHWNEYLFGEHTINEVLGRASTDCPQAVIEHLLPWFVRVTDLLTVKESETPDADETEREGYAWDALFATGWYGDHLSESAVLTNRIAEALGHLARTQPEEFRRIAEGLARSNSLAVHRVLANAYLAAPATYAADIIAYLMGDRRRLRLGEMDEPVYDSRRLFGAVFGLADDEQRSRLEDLILNLEPAWETRHPEYDYRGQTQLQFLRSVADIEQLSARARGRLAELEQRFPNSKLQAPQGMVVRFVGSPVDEETLASLSDDELLEAMRKYNDAYRRSAEDDPFAGGVAELAFAIDGRAKEEPERYYLLTRRFDDSISFRYVWAIIAGLAGANGAPAEWMFDLVRRFSSRITPDDRNAISSAINQRAADNVPDDLLDMMDDWALHDASPAADKWGEADQHGHKHYQGDPYTQGINSTRGIVVERSCRCALLAKPPRVERAFALLEKAAADPTTAVRSCVVEALNWMLRRGEDDRALNIFDAATEGHPRILQSPVAHRFLHGSYFRHFKRIRRYVELLLSSEDDNTRQVGASLSCLSAFEYEEAKDLEERVMTGDPVMRLGAAQVYARQLGDPKLDNFCRGRLLTLMHDEDGDVLASVGVCFAHVRLEQFEGLRSFVEEFIQSPALLPGAKHLVKYFKQLAADEHELTLNVTERILDEGGAELFSMRKNRLLTDSELVVLPLTVYTHAHDPAIKARAIGLFERLLSIGSYAARQALNDWDRR